MDLGPRVVKSVELPLTAPMVMESLCALGNAKMKVPDDIRLLMDPHRDGPGVRIELELPRGVTASFVMERREELAAALRRELGTVWPSVGRRHPGHLVLFVSDQVMAQAEQEPWPLLNAGEVDIFTAIPLFTNQRGAWIKLSIAYASII
ncbi:cell division protein FtsK, partial [Streptosporangium nondiastaticum]